MKRALSWWFASLVLVLASGCSSYDVQATRGRSVQDVKRFFVLSNSNDNHALDRQIQAALQLRSRDAEVGPLTMMPDETEAIVSYEDHWTWDFGDHLSYLQLTVRDRRSNQILTTVRFAAKIPSRRSPATIIGELVDRMVAKN